ncbi:MAG TPA: outer membrane beta-barrel protein [Kofleriaceae bacterium]|nr:outer membrane beta-barrel protein [Kofleriaceae bacterium]
MKCAIFVAAGLAISTPALADGYLGLGLGTQPAVNDAMMSTARPDGRSARGLAGVRFGNVSLEGALNGFGVIADRERNMYQLSAALKLSIPLGNNFEAFGRGGLERTWLSLDNRDLAGDGYLFGGGFEYRLSALIANASLFLDYSYHSATLDDVGQKIDVTSRFWGLGFTVGI